MQIQFLFVFLLMMNIKFKVSTGKFFTSFSGSQLKELNRLQKSVSSIGEGLSDLSSRLQESNQEFIFSLAEISAAIKRIEKNDNKFRYPLADIDIDKYVEYKSHYSQRYINESESFIVSLFKAIFGFVVPGFHYYDNYAYCKTDTGLIEIHMSDIEEAIMAELYYRRTTRILRNILSRFFESRNLIIAESPIKIITYKYFDLIFSLKKEVALITRLVPQFFNELIYYRENEKKYFGNIQVTC